MPSKEHVAAYNKQYALENKEAIHKQKKQYRSENRERLKERDRKRYANNKNYYTQTRISYYSQPEKKLKRALYHAKERAIDKGLEFNLTLEDLIILKDCPYLSVEITYLEGKGNLPSNVSLDRIDNSKGYIKGNVRTVSSLANTMKSSSTREQREAFAKAILSDPTL